MKRVTDQEVIDDAWRAFQEAVDSRDVGAGVFPSAMKRALPVVQKKYPKVCKLEFLRGADGITFAVFES